MVQFILEPNGWPCTLEEAEPGFFRWKGEFCMKTEYLDEGGIMAYCDTGERFWGGQKSSKDTDSLIVQPCVAVAREE